MFDWRCGMGISLPHSTDSGGDAVPKLGFITDKADRFVIILRNKDSLTAMQSEDTHHSVTGVEGRCENLTIWKICHF